MVQDAQAPGYSCRTASAEGRHCEEAFNSSKDADKNTTAGHGNKRRSAVLRDNAMHTSPSGRSRIGQNTGHPVEQQSNRLATISAMKRHRRGCDTFLIGLFVL